MLWVCSVNVQFASCLEPYQPSRLILTSHAPARDTKGQDSLKCPGYFSKAMQSAIVLWAYSMNFYRVVGKGMSLCQWECRRCVCVLVIVSQYLGAFLK